VAVWAQAGSSKERSRKQEREEVFVLFGWFFRSSFSFFLLRSKPVARAHWLPRDCYACAFCQLQIAVNYKGHPSATKQVEPRSNGSRALLSSMQNSGTADDIQTQIPTKSCQQRARRSHKEARLRAAWHVGRPMRPNRERTQ
jgi:hypothetical protein